MKKLPLIVLAILVCCPLMLAAQNKNMSTGSAPATKSTKRGPVFRATKDQIKQAQGILKQRGFYPGEQTGQLDDSTRSGLKRYQEAEGVKVTGTLNKVTLEKMGVPLTDRQKTM